jgi:hypothetical protein
LFVTGWSFVGIQLPKRFKRKIQTRPRMESENIYSKQALKGVARFI